MIEPGRAVLYLTPAADRFFLVSAGYELSAGNFVVVSIPGAQQSVDEAALAPFEVSEEQVQAHVRTQVERLATRGIDLGDMVDALPGYLAALRQLDQGGATRAAARGLRALADVIEGDQASLGRRIDELIAQLERELGPLAGMEWERRQRQEEYRRSARSAIADALRAAGITPLASTGPADTASEDRDGPDRE